MKPPYEPAEHPDSIAVAEFVSFECAVDDREDIVDVDAAPAGPGRDRVFRAEDGLAPRGVAAAAAARVTEDDDEAGGGLHLRLVEEVVAVLGERPSMYVEQDGIGSRLVEIDGAHDPTVDLFGRVGGGHGEPFPRQQRRRQSGADLRPSFVVDPQLRREVDGATNGCDASSGGVERRHRDSPGGHGSGWGRSIDGDAVEVGFAPILRDGEQGVVVLPHR